MQINRYVNGKKMQKISLKEITNREIREVVREVQRRIRSTEAKA